MFWRLLVVVWVLAAMGAGVLSLRRERLATTHRIARCHEAINAARLEIRSRQPELAALAAPQALEDACRRAGLKLEPIAPAGQAPVDPAVQNPKPGGRR